MNRLLKRQDHLAILRIVLIYSFFGGLWIYLSDSILELFVKDPEMFTQIAIFKGWMFILTTAILLYVLIARRMKIIIGSEKLLKRSEERFKQIAENAEEIIWELDKDGIFTYISPVFETIIGYKPEEIVDKKYFYDLIDPALKDKAKEIFSDIFANKKVMKRFIIHCVHKNGQIIILESNASPFISSQGNLVGYRGASIDITERNNAEMALQESEEKYRTLIQTSPDAILMLSLKGEILLTNEEAAIIHEYKSKEEMIGLNAECLIPSEEVEHIYKNLEMVLKTGKSVYDEYIFIKKDGDRFFADLNLSVVFDAGNKPKAVIGVARDITERKISELELEKYRLKLEDLVTERTKKIEEVNLQLQEEILKQKEAEEKVILALVKEKELNTLKSEFISTASHEFRTPLATILSSAELIERYWNKQDKDKFRDHIERIKNAIKYLTGLMDDVLIIGRSETGKTNINFEKTDLIKICKSIIGECSAAITDKHKLNIDLQLGDGIFYVDEKLIKLILNNLLSNAIKFSANGGNIGFNAKTSDAEIIFEISDDGIGIPAEDQSRIFEPFDRGSNIGAIRGTGLGMSIVKRSLELHNGTISIDSKIGYGTKVVIIIPRIQNEHTF